MENVSKKLAEKAKERIPMENNIVVFILTMMAGWVDTVSIMLFLKGESGFMTGRIHTLALHLFNLDSKLFSRVLFIIIAFIIGSYISTIITKKVGLKGGLIFTGILIIISSLPVIWKYVSIIFLPMAMGGQNAATSLTPLSRTTHLSGVTTDIGINIAGKNWDKVFFGGCSLLGFPLGAFIGYNLSSIIENSSINKSIILIVPAFIIILTGIIQEKFVDIPILD